MYRLRTFGGLTLVDSAGVATALKQRRLALLAVLAVAGDRGVSRERLAGMLWPESPGERARHALEQLVYSARQELAPEPFNGTDPLRLNPASIGSDVADFLAALAAGALSEAIGLHHAPFLEGFYLDDSPAFEHWSESERSRLSTEHAGALYRLAKQAGAEGEHTLEIDWWRRLAGTEPLSERTALGLARALVDAGDWAGALQCVEAFDARVRRELELPPSPELASFVERLRAEHGAARLLSDVGASAPAERYRIERELGRGSMATVYLARDLKHERPVALKVLRPVLAASIEAKRFLREIDIIARLHHPHILHLYDSGMMRHAGGPSTPFYVMPFVRGESLRDVLGTVVQLPPGQALEIARQIASAVRAAHDQGVLHRDIKPGNILLESGQALLADFGIAHALDLAGGEQLSRSGVVLGTPGYMSPEQAAGTPALDARSDIYSLACVVYEMLAGGPPFTGRTTQIILARHASDPVPSIRTVCPTLAPAVEAAILRALAKDPAARFATVDEFARALGPVSGATT